MSLLAGAPTPPALSFDLLGAPARLADPGRLWLLAAVVAVALLSAWAIHRRRAALARAAGALGPRVAPTAGAARPAARLSLATLGLALLALALSRPQCGTRTEVARRFGVDVVLVVDASRSMRARDVAPDRFTRAALELRALLDGLAGDRVAVVAFAGDAYVACPLTTDGAAAGLFLRGVAPERFPHQGTAVAEALRLAGEVLARAERGARSRVVLVVSDGEDQEGGAEAAAQALADGGARVFALAVGTPGGAPVPILDASGNLAGYKLDAAGQPVVSRLDLGALEALTAKGNGSVLALSGAGGGAEGFRAELDRMEKTDLGGVVTTAWEDRYALFAFPALLLLLGSLLLREARAPAGDAAEDAAREEAA